MPKNVGVVLTLKDRFSSKLKDVAEKLNTTEKQLNKATMTVRKFSNQVGKSFQTAVAGVSAGVGALVGTSYALANKTSEAGDRIDKMSLKLGMSRKAFQELDYVFSQAGINMDSFGAGIKTMTQAVYDSGKKGSETGKIFQQLGVSVRNQNGTFRNQEEIFKDTLTALQKMPAGVNKAVFAQKLFGKQGQQLMPLLEDNNKNVQELINKAHDLGMVMSDDVVDASVKFNDTQDTLKRSINAVGYTIGAGLIPIMQQASDYIIANMPKIRQVAQTVLGGISGTLKFLIDNMNWLIPVATACVSSIVAFNTISGVIKTVQTLRSVIQAVSVAQGIWNAMMLANPIGLIAMGVGALIGVVALLIMNWDKVTQAVQVFWNKTVEVMSGLWNKCKEVFSAIGGFIKEHFVDMLMLAIAPVGLIIKGIKGIGGAISKLRGGNSGGNENESGEKPPKHALGTPYFAGGQTSINEGGRGEIVNLPSGSQIIPHDISKNSGKNITLKVDFNVNGNLIGTRELFEQFADMLLIKVENKLQTV